MAVVYQKNGMIKEPERLESERGLVGMPFTGLLGSFIISADGGSGAGGGMVTNRYIHIGWQRQILKTHFLEVIRMYPVHDPRINVDAAPRPPA